MGRYKHYQARVELDDDAKILHGEVLNIRDVITFQGKSVEELQQAFEDSVNEYLAYCAEQGLEPEQPATADLWPQHQKTQLGEKNIIGKTVKVYYLMTRMNIGLKIIRIR